MPIDTAKLAADLERLPAESPFSGVVTVHQRGQQVFAQAYGYANKPDSLPNKIDTKFAVASGAKTFTAVAVCQLIEQGKLALDARLADVLDRLAVALLIPTSYIYCRLRHLRPSS